MIDSILYRIRCGDIQALDEAVRSWGQQSNGVSVGDIEDAVRVCLSLPKDLQDIWDSAWKRASRVPAEHQEAGERVREFFDGALSTSQRLRDLIQRYDQQGQAISGGHKVDSAVEEIRRLRDQFMDSWLWINEAIRKESDEEYARGDFQTVQEILDELQGKHP